MKLFNYPIVNFIFLYLIINFYVQDSIKNKEVFQTIKDI